MTIVTSSYENKAGYAAHIIKMTLVPSNSANSVD